MIRTENDHAVGIWIEKFSIMAGANCPGIVALCSTGPWAGADYAGRWNERFGRRFWVISRTPSGV